MSGRGTVGLDQEACLESISRGRTIARCGTGIKRIGGILYFFRCSDEKAVCFEGPWVL